jgi:integrase
MKEYNECSLIEAIKQYKEYLAGNHPLAHKKKVVSKKHQYECIHFCEMFINIVRVRTDVTRLSVSKVTKYDVSNFYKWLGEKYAPKTFNKGMIALKGFFKFLIDDEEIVMRNPFSSYVSKRIVKKNILSLTSEEFKMILEAVDTANPIQELKGNITKNRFKIYLKEGLKLCLYTGLRREEVVELRWSDIYQTQNHTLFFKLHNLKVERSLDVEDIPKYVPIYPDLKDVLDELGYQYKIHTNEYILYPNRTETSRTIMDCLSKGFTHYKNAAGITRPLTLKNLRKTYLSWVNQALGRDTGKITSHSSHKILEDHYIDPIICTLIDKGAMEIRIFGNIPNSHS